jgi:hypothetical protein
MNAMMRLSTMWLLPSLRLSVIVDRRVGLTRYREMRYEALDGVCSDKVYILDVEKKLNQPRIRAFFYKPMPPDTTRRRGSDRRLSIVMPSGSGGKQWKPTALSFAIKLKSMVIIA